MPSELKVRQKVKNPELMARENKAKLQFRIKQINKVNYDFFAKLQRDLQQVGADWQKTTLKLTPMKDLVDTSNFVFFDDFDSAYDAVLDRLAVLEQTIQTAIDDLNEFNVDIRAIVPEELKGKV